MENVQFGSALLGMNNVSQETALPGGAMRDILNFDVTSEGHLTSRAGARRLSTAQSLHSLWSPRSHNFGLYAQGSDLRKLVTQGVSMQATTILQNLAISERVKFYEYADEVFFTNGTDLGVVTDGGARRIGLLEPVNAPTASEYVGSLPAGRYGVAYSYISTTGEESALSLAVFIEATGGIAVDLPNLYPENIASVRIYATLTNGDLLYMAQDVPVGTLVARVQDDQRSKLATTQFMSRMTGGDDISVSNGVLFVSNGKTLRFSEPFNYGLTDKKTGFVSFGSNILFHEPVSDGLYVGTEDGVYFLSGSSPKDFTQRLVGSAPVVSDSICVPASLVSVDPAPADSLVAVWLGVNGFVLGYSGGQVANVQTSNMTLGQHGLGTLVNVTANGVKKVISLVEVATTKSHESASDSFI